MGIIYFIAFFVALAAIFYGVWTMFSVGLSALKMLIGRRFKLAGFYFMFDIIVLLGFVGLLVLLNLQPVEWPFSPLHIPLYVTYIYFCHYSTVILPKKWK